MKQKGKYLLFTRQELGSWLNKENFKRKISIIQNHHTLQPDYTDFNNNHFSLLEGMENYHVKSRGFSDIAQNLTTFPDGLIAVCRSFESDPAGIKGANAGAIFIENLGNFDIHEMTSDQKQTVIFVNAILCKKFSIPADTDHILYHHWYDLNTGTKTNGSGTVKSCPGVKFFGGNTIESAQEVFIPLVKEAMKLSFNDAVDIISSKTGIDKEYWKLRKGIDPYFETLMIKIARSFMKII